MNVYPSILLRKGDTVKIPNGNNVWYVADVIEWTPMLCDGTHIFCPRWGFYVKKDGVYIPILD